MSSKTFMQLAVALALLVGVSYYLNRNGGQRASIEGVIPGDPVFSGLDVNEVASVQIASASSTVTLARAESGWTAVELYGYPASFPSIAGFLRKLDELKVGQVVREGTRMLSEYGLNEEESPEALSVRLFGASGAELAVVTMGAVKQQADPSGMGMGRPQGRYLRAGDGPVLLVEEPFMELSTRAEEWIDRQLPDLLPEAVARVDVSAGGEAYAVARGEDGALVLEGLAEGESLDDAAASRLVQGGRWMRFDSVVDPGLSDEEAGLTGVDAVSFTMTNGLVYAFSAARAADGDTDRVLKLSVSAAGADQADEAARLNARHAAWRYRVPVHMVDLITPKRASLLEPGPDSAPEPEDDQEE